MRLDQSLLRWTMTVLLAGCGPTVGEATTGGETTHETGEGDDTGDDMEPEHHPTLVGHCSPRASDCPQTHHCCSDDPAAWNGGLPAYRDDIPNAEQPLFSAQNNDLGTSGMCVQLDDVPCGSGLGQSDASGACEFPNCPIPCNPTWSTADVAHVCGPMRECCQTRELEPNDCVLDGGVWRPVTGKDVPDKTTWSSSEHSTHQDPNGQACSALAAASDLQDETFRMCLDQLGVANQRGYCMPVCPPLIPEGPDACEQLNEG
jgi:hypothetical protein